MLGDDPPAASRRIIQIAEKWKIILAPVLSMSAEPGQSQMVTSQLCALNLDLADVATLAGYLVCFHVWPDCRLLAEVVVAYHRLLPEEFQSVFKWAILGPLTSYAACCVHQGALLYRLTRLGLTSFGEVRQYVNSVHPWWFWVESGRFGEAAESARYARRRDEYQGFGIVADTIMRDDDRGLGELTSIVGFDAAESRLPRASGMKDAVEKLNINHDESLLPVGMGILEDEWYSLLEFALRWGASRCVRVLLQRGGVPKPRALWAAIQGGDLNLLDLIDQTMATQGTVLDDEVVSCGVAFAIRLFRVAELEWLLRRFPSTIARWDQERRSLMLDTAAMSNNLPAWGLLYEAVPELQWNPANWLMFEGALFHGNVEVLEAFFPPDPAHPSRHVLGENHLCWVLRSLRLDALKWFCEHCRELAITQYAVACAQPFWQAWLARRPEQGAILAQLVRPAS